VCFQRLVLVALLVVTVKYARTLHAVGVEVGHLWVELRNSECGEIFHWWVRSERIRTFESTFQCLLELPTILL
jgi:hypothetical protein